MSAAHNTRCSCVWLCKVMSMHLCPSTASTGMLEVDFEVMLKVIATARLLLLVLIMCVTR